jgi:hypothetical protein
MALVPGDYLIEMNVIVGLAVGLVVGLATMVVMKGSINVHITLTLTEPVQVVCQHIQADNQEEQGKEQEEVQGKEQEQEQEVKPVRINPILAWNLYVSEVFDEMALELGILRDEYTKQKDYIADCKEAGLTRKDATEEAKARKAARK